MKLVWKRLYPTTTTPVSVERRASHVNTLGVWRHALAALSQVCL